MKILMVGLGGIGQRHLRNLKSILGPEATFEAFRVRGLDHLLTDRLQIDPGASLDETYGLKVYHDLDQAVAGSPTAAFICNPSSLHVPVAVRLAQAGCHLFLEKPLSHSLEGTEDLLRTVAAKGLVGLVGYQMRFHPAVRRTRTWVQEGRLGRILAVQAEIGEYLPGWHPYEDYRRMYAARADLGGGVILSQIHELDYLGWILGWPTRVYAVGGHLSCLDVDVEDTASLLLTVPREGQNIPVHVHMDFVQRPPRRTCRILGDEGQVLLDLHAAAATLLSADGQVRETEAWPDLERNRLFLDQTAHFLACIQGQETPLTSLKEGLRSLKVALAAKTSLATGLPVDLEESLP